MKIGQLVQHKNVPSVIARVIGLVEEDAKQVIIKPINKNISFRCYIGRLEELN